MWSADKIEEFKHTDPNELFNTLKLRSTWRAVRYYLDKEAAAKIQADTLYTMAEDTILPIWSCGLGLAPSFMPRSEKARTKVAEYARKCAPGLLTIMAECLTEEAIEHGLKQSLLNCKSCLDQQGHQTLDLRKITLRGRLA